MNTENQGTGEAQENQGGGSQNGEANVANSSFEVEGDLSALEGLIPQERIQEISTKNQQKEQKPAGDQESGENNPGGDAGNAEGSKNKNPEQKKPEGENKEQKSVFGLNKKKENKAPAFEIENPDQIVDIVKSKFGLEVSNIKELPKFFEVTQKWREDSQKLGTVQKEAENFKKILEGLPVDMIEGIKAYYKGEDYSKIIGSKPKFDYSLPAEKQDVKSLVNHYFPNEFEESDFAEEVKSKTLQIAEKAALDKFEAERQKYNENLSKTRQAAEQRLESIKQSVTATVSSLKQDFPDMDDEEVTSISSTLEGGPQKVLEFFFNSDSTLKPDAAKKLAMAIHGENEIKKMMDVSAHVTETRINEDLLTKGADRPNPVKNAQKVNQVDPEVEKMIQEIRGIGKKQTF